MTLRTVARSILSGTIVFLLLTFVLFLYWRHFSIDYLVATFINPHSSIPKSLQIQMAEHYLHLDLPFYLQYFGFLFNFFTGRWGYSQFFNPLDSGYYTFAVHPVIVGTLPTTLFIMLAGSAFSILLIRLFPGHVFRSGRIWPTSARILLILLTAVAIPLILRFLVTGVTLFFKPASMVLSGPGYEVLQNSPQNWITSYIQGVIVHTSPTGVPFIDALINLRVQDALYLLRGMFLIILSTSVVLFITDRLLKRSDNRGENVIQKFGYYFVFAVIFSTAFSEYIFNYFGGLGYYAGFLNPFAGYIALYKPPEYDIWLQVYLLLAYGIIIIVLSVGASLLRTVHRSNS